MPFNVVDYPTFGKPQYNLKNRFYGIIFVKLLGGSNKKNQPNSKLSKQNNDNDDNDNFDDVIQAVDQDGYPLCLFCSKRVAAFRAGVWEARFCSENCMKEFKVYR